MTDTDPLQRPIAVLDIDGVLADVRHRLHHLDRQPKNWSGFFAAATRDPLLPEGAAVAATLAGDHEIVYLTGRPERCRRDTVAWLEQHALPQGTLLMRPDDDRRPARQTKLAHLRTLGRRGTVAVLVDDDPDVIAAAGKAGLPTMLADWVPRAPSLARAQDVEDAPSRSSWTTTTVRVGYCGNRCKCRRVRYGTPTMPARTAPQTRDDVITMCQHRPTCPEASACDHDAARIVSSHPEQGWHLLCNGVLLFDDNGELLPDGSALAPRRVAPPARSAA